MSSAENIPDDQLWADVRHFLQPPAPGELAAVNLDGGSRREVAACPLGAALMQRRLLSAPPEDELADAWYMLSTLQKEFPDAPPTINPYAGAWPEQHHGSVMVSLAKLAVAHSRSKARGLILSTHPSPSGLLRHAAIESWATVALLSSQTAASTWHGPVYYAPRDIVGLRSRFPNVSPNHLLRAVNHYYRRQYLLPEVLGRLESGEATSLQELRRRFR